jgi:hypothetical protein
MRRGGSVPNLGGGRLRRRPSLGGATYVFEGTVRFVDRRGDRAALRVEDGNRLGRRFTGHTVTLDLSAARISARDRNADGQISPADLVAGDRVIAAARLARGLAEPPGLVPVRRLFAGEPPPEPRSR